MLHTINPEILFLKQEDGIKAGLLDMKQILAVTEKTYAMLGQGLIKNPPFLFQFIAIVKCFTNH